MHTIGFIVELSSSTAAPQDHHAWLSRSDAVGDIRIVTGTWTGTVRAAATAATGTARHSSGAGAKATEEEAGGERFRG